MNHLYNFILFIIANSAGFFSISLIYHLSIALGIFKLDNALLDNGALQEHYFTGTTLAWMVCTALSLGFFIIRDNSRWLFLLLPLLLPIAYGLSVLVRLDGSVPS